MKFEIEIDDLINEDGTLSTEMHEMVVVAIANKVDRAELLQLRDEAKSRVGAILDAKVGELLEQWLTTAITCTDDYGDPTEAGTLIDLLKQRFDKFWDQKVDSSGRSSSGYGAKQTRLEWLIDTRVASLCEKFAKDMALEVKKQVTAVMSDKLKVAIGGSLIDAIGLPEIVKRLSA
jgi:hypothetical protein